jgi:SecD/SecF fusion protein
MENFRKEFPLFALLTPSTDQMGNLFPGPVVGIAHARDTSEVNSDTWHVNRSGISFRGTWYFAGPQNRWMKPGYFRLIALKATTRDGKAPLTGEVITDARQDFDQFGGVPKWQCL